MWKWLLVLLLFSSGTNAFAAERIVLLAPAAGDILQKLKAESLVVGVTRSLQAFPAAVRVGSHIRPNLELIRSANPDLIIISSNRFFSKEMQAALGIPVFSYHPQTLNEILTTTLRLAARLERAAAGEALVKQLQLKLAEIKPVQKPPRVVYEVSALPLTVAGRKNIVADLIRAAGGIPLPDIKRKMVRFNVEALLTQQPDIYLYQVGPMNKKPQPPGARASFSTLQAQVRQVDELAFARANSGSFERVLELNRWFLESR